MRNFGGTQNYPCGPYALNLFIFFTVLLFTFLTKAKVFLTILTQANGALRKAEAGIAALVLFAVWRVGIF